jgi:hypothetical protein
MNKSFRREGARSSVIPVAGPRRGLCSGSNLSLGLDLRFPSIIDVLDGQERCTVCRRYPSRRSLVGIRLSTRPSSKDGSRAGYWEPLHERRTRFERFLDSPSRAATVPLTSECVKYSDERHQENFEGLHASVPTKWPQMWKQRRGKIGHGLLRMHLRIWQQRCVCVLWKASRREIGRTHTDQRGEDEWQRTRGGLKLNSVFSLSSATGSKQFKKR